MFAVHRPYVVHPILHAVKLILQDRHISAEHIYVPGDNAGRVAPGAGTFRLPIDRHGLRYHSVQILLLLIQVKQILFIERVSIREIAGCGGKHLGISGPPHPLIPLGAVGGHVQEIPSHSPLHVGDQSVHQFVSRPQGPCRFVIAAEHQRSKVVNAQFLHAADLHVAISVIRKMRLDFLFRSI